MCLVIIKMMCLSLVNPSSFFRERASVDRHRRVRLK
jgi:hypothetical protein